MTSALPLPGCDSEEGETWPVEPKYVLRTMRPSGFLQSGVRAVENKGRSSDQVGLWDYVGAHAVGLGAVAAREFQLWSPADEWLSRPVRDVG